MNGRQQESTATNDDDALELFVRSSPRDLEPGDLSLVAGGTGPCLVPDG